jgi:putative endonuclease
MYYTYILQSINFQRLYIGSTEDLKRRFIEHNKGKVISTKPYRPWKLIYYEAHLTKTLARKSELFYKTGQGRRQLKKKLGLKN